MLYFSPHIQGFWLYIPDKLFLKHLIPSIFLWGGVSSFGMSSACLSNTLQVSGVGMRHPVVAGATFRCGCATFWPAIFWCQCTAFRWGSSTIQYSGFGCDISAASLFGCAVRVRQGRPSPQEHQHGADLHMRSCVHTDRFRHRPMCSVTGRCCTRSRTAPFRLGKNWKTTIAWAVPVGLR